MYVQSVYLLEVECFIFSPVQQQQQLHSFGSFSFFLISFCIRGIFAFTRFLLSARYIHTHTYIVICWSIRCIFITAAIMIIFLPFLHLFHFKTWIPVSFGSIYRIHARTVLHYMHHGHWESSTARNWTDRRKKMSSSKRWIKKHIGTSRTPKKIVQGILLWTICAHSNGTSTVEIEINDDFEGKCRR